MHWRHFSRRSFLHLMGGALLSATARGEDDPRDSARRRGAAFLAGAQCADGAWRSAHYGFFRGGDALTPLILLALRAMPAAEQDLDTLARGTRWLDALTDRIEPLDEPWLQLRYPLFSASYAARYYAGRGDTNRAAVWANCIQALQLTSRLGWSRNDPRHGGWSDAPAPPQCPPGSAVPDMLNPNLSATAIAALGLEAASRRDSARSAEAFILRCQNWPGDSSTVPSAFDDGGFFFALDDPTRSKAGAAGRDPNGRLRLRSYGSATCDGVLALLALGYQISHPRIGAALKWLSARSGQFVHPGDWPSERADSARALIFYYAQAMGQLLDRCAEPWAAVARPTLARGLAACQRADGSWSNPDPESCEDDPLVATAFALSGLPG